MFILALSYLFLSHFDVEILSIWAHRETLNVALNTPVTSKHLIHIFRDLCISLYQTSTLPFLHQIQLLLNTTKQWSQSPVCPKIDLPCSPAQALDARRHCRGHRTPKKFDQKVHKGIEYGSQFVELFTSLCGTLSINELSGTYNG